MEKPGVTFHFLFLRQGGASKGLDILIEAAKKCSTNILKSI
jgi:hypothetical protein